MQLLLWKVEDKVRWWMRKNKLNCIQQYIAGRIYLLSDLENCTKKSDPIKTVPIVGIQYSIQHSVAK